MNPKQNSFVLGVFSLTLSILDNDPGLGVWLKGNGSELNKFLIETINKNKDPDLIKNFTILQVKILLYDELIFLECKEFDEIMKVLLDSLLEINEYSMTKEILLFFNSFMGVPKGIHHPNMMKFLPEIIKCFIFSLPEINRNFLIYLIHAFQALIKTYGMNNNELYLFIRNLLNDGRFTCLTEKQKVFFIKFNFLNYGLFFKLKFVYVIFDFN